MKQDISFSPDSLASFVTDAAVDDSTLLAARRGLLDWCGAAIAGSREPAGRIARELVTDPETAGAASVVGTTVGTSPIDAAFANGVAGHALDVDDTHLMSAVHATATTLPAALATAESIEASGLTALRGYVIGFEVATYLGELLHPVHHDAPWHATAVFGTVGAAAASAAILGLNHSQNRSALGLAATQAAGLRVMFGTMGKSLHAGRAAASGILAATLASRGFEGPLDAFSSEQGYFAHLGAHEAQHFSAVALGGRPIRILDNDFKLHACCHATHAAVDAAVAIHGQRVPLSDVAEVRIYCNRAVPTVAGKRTPRTGLEAKFSVGYAVLTALHQGTAGAREFTDSVVASSPVQARLNDVRIIVVDAYSIRHARVEVTLRNGSLLAADVDAPRGSAPNPASWDELTDKFHTLVDPVVGHTRAKEISRMIGEGPRGTAHDFLRQLTHQQTAM